jgi:hypothetical protein
MPSFRKKPVVVEAEQWFPDKEVAGVYIIPEHDVPSRGGGVAFRQPERAMVGTAELSPGEWVLTQGGERHACADELFRQLYEPVD